MSKSTKIVLVGHCGPDSWALKNAVRRAIATAEIVMADSDRELESHPDAALLLVNRALDGDFDAEDGIELIREINKQSPAPRTMLVSNFEEAQSAAVSAGALRGFGKRELGSSATAEKISAAVNDNSSQEPGEGKKT